MKICIPAYVMLPHSEIIVGFFLSPFSKGGLVVYQLFSPHPRPFVRQSAKVI
jgi:hypothetical protein